MSILEAGLRTLETSFGHICALTTGTAIIPTATIIKATIVVTTSASATPAVIAALAVATSVVSILISIYIFNYRCILVDAGRHHFEFITGKKR